MPYGKHKPEAGFSKPRGWIIETPPFFLAFPSLFEPTSFAGMVDKLRYRASGVLLSDLCEPLDAATREVAAAIWGPWRRGWNSPIHAEGQARGVPLKHRIFNATSERRPLLRVLDGGRARLPDTPDDIPAGCVCRAEICPFAYDTPFSAGVAFSLLSLTKLSDAPPPSEEVAQALASVEDWIR